MWRGHLIILFFMRVCDLHLSRYTEWVRFHGNPDYTPDWGEQHGVELYDHQRDPQENTNQAGNPEYRAAVEQHRQLLHGGWKRVPIQENQVDGKLYDNHKNPEEGRKKTVNRKSRRAVSWSTQLLHGDSSRATIQVNDNDKNENNKNTFMSERTFSYVKASVGVQVTLTATVCYFCYTVRKKWWHGITSIIHW